MKKIFVLLCSTGCAFILLLNSCQKGDIISGTSAGVNSLYLIEEDSSGNKCPIYNSRSEWLSASVPLTYSRSGWITTEGKALFVIRKEGEMTLGKEGWAPENQEILHWGSVTQPAIDSMEAYCQYIRVATPVDVSNNIIIDVPLYFEIGGYVNISSGVKLTANSTVEAPEFYVFRGDGTVQLGTPPLGGETRVIKAVWFGVKVGVLSNIGDQAPAIQKAFNAIGNTSEGVVEFEAGPVPIAGSIEVYRGIWIKGAGIRRGLFKVMGDGFIPFRVTGEAVKFTDIQFEHDTQLTQERQYPYIRVIGANCEISDVVAGRAKTSIEILGSGCRLNNVEGFYNVAGSSGSSLISIRGSNHSIENVRITSSASFGPKYAICIGDSIGGADLHTTSTGNIAVKGVMLATTSGALLIDGSFNHVSNIRVADLTSVPTNTAPGITIQTYSGNYTMQGLQLYGLQFGTNVQEAVWIQMNGGGTMRDISIDNLGVLGSSGCGIRISRVSGSLNTILIGSNVSIRHRAYPLCVAGTVSNLIVAAGILPED